MNDTSGATPDLKTSRFVTDRFHRVNSFLELGWCASPAWLAYAASAGISLIYILSLLPLSFIAGSGAYFEHLDVSANVAGWKYFRASDWHLPLLYIERLNFPGGANIAFTDSVPLAAIPFKLISALLPPNYHYFGLWHAIAFFTQALAAVFLIRLSGVRHLPGAIAATVFAITWPALLWRLGHAALMTHAVILMALGWSALAARAASGVNRRLAALMLTCACGLLVHPYFLAFTYPLFLATLVDRGIAGEKWRLQLMRLGASLVFLLLVFLLFGYLRQGSATTTSGFGFYSMNLAAPFCGGRFLQCGSEPLNLPFSYSGFADPTGGQYEGYNYFGLGMLLLIPFALAGEGRRITGWFRRHPALALVVVLFFLYAVSTEIYFHKSKLASYALPAWMDSLTGTFRASGRFFWVPSYVILFAVLAAACRKRPAFALPVLLLCTLIQWMDTGPLRDRLRGPAREPETHQLDAWKEAMAGVEAINVFPAFGCNEKEVEMYRRFQELAAHYNKRLNSGYTARPNVSCKTSAQTFEQSFAPNALYVIPLIELENPFNVPRGFYQAAAAGMCRGWSTFVICRTDVNAAFWERSGLETTAPRGLPAAKRQTWSGASLRTQVGKLERGRLVAGTDTPPGFLSFGPYAALPEGHYRFNIVYASTAPSSTQAGDWELTSSSGKTSFSAKRGALPGTQGDVKEITGEFAAKESGQLWEIRTNSVAGAPLEIVSITIEAAGDSGAAGVTAQPGKSAR
jgi:hypothetical protein